MKTLVAYHYLALVLAHARSLAFLASAPLALVLVDARSLAFPASASCALVLAGAHSEALLAWASLGSNACSGDAVALTGTHTTCGDDTVHDASERD